MRLSIDASEVSRVVGGGAYARGLRYALEGRVLTRVWDGSEDALNGRVKGSDRVPYDVSVGLDKRPDGTMRVIDSWCTCYVGSFCKHVAALLLSKDPAQARKAPQDTVADTAGLSAPERAGSRGPGQRRSPRPKAPARPAAAPAARSWSHVLDSMIAVGHPSHTGAPLALQFEFTPPAGGSEAQLRARPVMRSTTGRWIRTGISWSAITGGYSYAHDPGHVRALAGLHAVVVAGKSGYARYLAGSEAWLALEETSGLGFWGALEDARRMGVELVQAGAAATPVVVSEEPAELHVDLRRESDDGAIAVRTTVRVGSEALEAGGFRVLGGGGEATGLFWWSSSSESGSAGAPRQLGLARFARPLRSHAASLACEASHLLVPAEDAERFFHRYYPILAAHAEVGSADHSVRPPEPPRPVLVLTVRAHPGHVVDVEWEWHYRSEGDDVVGRCAAGPSAQPGAGARASAKEELWRSAAAEAGVLAGVLGPGGVLAGLEAASPLVAIGATGAQALGGPGRLTSWQTAGLVSEVIPRLHEASGVEVVTEGELADYRESAGPAQVTVAAQCPAGGDGLAIAGADRDWFDLAITVAVDGREVPLAPLLSALALGQDRLLLDDGLWLRIDTPALAELRALVEEARALEDRPVGDLRVSRFQVGMWAELEQLGVVVEQADAWRQAVADLRRLEAIEDDVTVPPAVRAELRPYQRTGFGWLARLCAAGLGGVLADDMGLGKTLQVLALAAWLRVPERSTRAVRAREPLLVVAPTSVVGNWAGEAARFVPDLRVRTIERTRAKRGEELALLAEGADVVVTSYTLFRLEAEDYAALGWSVLVLDEAQMVKNHESRAYACARLLPAPVKIAITGTPMENNLMELWALLGLVAPGLFASPKRFADYYRTPIERDGDAERLALLRRRVRPLLLRRTKELVAADLPPRLEHVMEVELAPRHRAVYDRYLQRERQKVLGLLADFDGNRFEIFRSLTLLRRLALDPSLVDPQHARVPATKLDALESMLAEIVADGHRVLVFSQFTGVLERVRNRLGAQGIEHAYLDGATRRRAKVIEGFRAGDAPVFLISLKAGGFGLTLTEADYVIVLDPWWNPAVEAQAVDRAHRIGQQRTVMVYRLVATGTIEEKVMALKAGKAKLFDAVMSGGDLADARLSAADVRSLLE